MSSFKTFSVRLGLALLPALLLGIYVHVPALAFLPYVALVPWVVLYTDDRIGRASIGHYVLGAYVTWIALYPSGQKFGWYALMVMGLFTLLPWIPFAPALRALHGRLSWPRAFTVPIVWTAVEWLRATLSPGHFDLYLLGYSQAHFGPLVQIADVTGVYGVTFLVAAVNGLLADVLVAWRDGSGVRIRRIAFAAAGVGAMFVAATVYGAIRLSMLRETPGPRIAIVQANTGHKPGAALVDHLEQLIQIEEDVPAGAADLIVLPENAVLDNVRREGLYLDDFAWLAERKKAPILVGAMSWPKELPGKKHNAAVLVDASGSILGQYNKQVLFPFTEFVPMDDVFGRVAPPLQRLLRRLIRMSWGAVPRAVPGTEMVLFTLPGAATATPFAVLLCSENTAPPVPAEASLKHAAFFINMTSEGDLGGPVQEQLLRICMFRAIENRIAYVRLGNTGISAFLDAGGRIRSILRGARGGTILEAGVLIDRVPISGAGTTAYAASRDAFAKGCVLATAILLLLGLRRRAAVAATVLAILVIPGCERFPSASGAAEAEAALGRAKQAVEARTPARALPDLIAACGDLGSCRGAMPLFREAFLRSHRLEDAVDFFPLLASRHPELAPEARANRGFFLDLLGRFPEALDEYKASLDARPTSEGFAAYGALRLKDDDVDGALAAYREAVRLAPSDPELRAQLARVLRLKGRAAEAEEILLATTAERPDAATAWAELGRIRIARGDARGAALAWEQARQADPSKLDVHFLLGRLAVREGRLADARQVLAGMKRIHATLRDLRRE